MARRMPAMVGGVAMDLAESPTAQTWRQAIGLEDEIGRGMREYGLQCYLPVQYTSVFRSIEGWDVLAETRAEEDQMSILVLVVLQQLAISSQGTTVVVVCPDWALTNVVKQVLLNVGVHTNVSCFDCSRPEGPHNSARSQVVVGTPAQVLKTIRDGTHRPSQTALLVAYQVDEQVARHLQGSLTELYRILPPDHQMLFTCTRSSPALVDLLMQLRGSPLVITHEDFPGPARTMKQYYSLLEEVDLAPYVIEDLFEALGTDRITVQCASQTFADDLHRHLQSTTTSGAPSSALIVDGPGNVPADDTGAQVLIVRHLTDEPRFSPVPRVLVVHDCGSAARYRYAVDVFGNLRPDGVCVALVNLARGDGFVAELRDVSGGRIQELMENPAGILS